VRKTCHVDDYGARGDGVSRDDEAIQAAIDRAIQLNREVELDARTYVLHAPLRIPNFVHLRGAYRGGDTPHVGTGDGRTILRGALPMSDVLGVTNGRTVRISDIVLDANWLADHCLYLAGCVHSHFERVTVGGARFDGVHLAKFHNGLSVINGGNVFRALETTANGRFFRTSGVNTDHLLAQQCHLLIGAKAHVASGDNVVAFSGVDLTVLGLRPGDPLRVVTGAREFFLVQGVLSDTTLRVSQAPDVTAVDCDFAIGRGDGYHEVNGSGDNNTTTFEGGLFRSNAGYAIALGGGYGCRVYGGQFDYGRFWAVRVGCDDIDPLVGTTVSMAPAFYSSYFESFERAPFLFRACTSAGVYHPTAPAHGYDTPHPESVRGVWVDDEGLWPIGTVRSRIPATKTLDARLEGHTELGGYVIQPVPTDVPLDASGVHWILRPGTTPVLLMGTPTLALRGSKPLWLQNDGPGAVTLQDESVLAGSKLKLRSPTLTLEEKQIVHFLCDGVHWIQVG
jgi:hypothetical protein